MNKKQFVAPLSIFCVSAVMLSMSGCSVSEIKDDVTKTFEEWISEVTDNAGSGAVIAESGASNGIRLVSATYTLSSDETEQSFSVGDNYDYSEDNAYHSVRITAFAEEDSPAPLTGVTWKVSFADKSIGGNVSEYVSLIPVTADGLTVQVNVKKFSSHEIVVTAVSSENSNVSGSISLHFVNRITSLTVSIPTVSLVSEKEYAVSVNGVVNSGTLKSDVTFARYVKFSSVFSDDSETYYPIDRAITGTAWKTFLTEHVKDEAVLEAMLSSDGGNNGYVGIYCTVTVSYNGKIYQFMTSEPCYPKFTNNEILSGSVTVGDNTTVVTPAESDSGNGSGAIGVIPSYIETEDNSLSIDMTGGDGDYIVTVDDNLQDKVTVTVTDGNITITNKTDEPAAGTVTVVSGNQSVDIPVAFITELQASSTSIVLEDVNGSWSDITITGGTGEYSVEVSDSLKDSVTVTITDSGIRITYHYNSDVSGTIKVVSGSQTITINVQLTNSYVVCLTGDTLITMADGSQKRIDEITYSDRVLAVNPETGEYVATGVTYTDSSLHKVYNHYDRFEFDDGTVIKVVHRHRFYNCEDGKMIHLDMFTLGDRAYKIDGTTPKLIFAKEHYEEKETKHYTLFTEMQNYFANGLLSGNRFTQPIKFTDIKGVSQK